MSAIYDFVMSPGNLGEASLLQGKTQPALRALREEISGMEELKRRNFSQGYADNPLVQVYPGLPGVRNGRPYRGP